MADIVMIIAQSMFRDEELFVTKERLGQLGHNVTVASRRQQPCQGSRGGTAMPDMTVGAIRSGDFDAIIFVGGGGASEYFADEAVHRLAADFDREGKVVAAICIAPVILANAGLLSGRRATVFPSGAEDLRRGGADYTGETVTRDGRIVTGNGPQSAREFAERVSETLGEAGSAGGRSTGPAMDETKVNPQK